METGYSIQLVLLLAGREAVESGYEYIELEHLFNALLKFAELASSDLARLLKDATNLPALLEEQAAVREVFLEYGHSIPEGTTALRRSLRKRMGVGGFKQDRQRIIHRSEESRRLCQRAEELARETRTVSWRGGHLASALFESPKGCLAEALNVEKNKIPTLMETPLLDHYGRNLGFAGIGAAREKTADPAVKVVFESIQNDGETNLLLIEAGGSTALDVIGSVAVLPWPVERQPRFVQLDFTRIGNDAIRKPGLIEGLLDEAVRIQAVLFLEGLTEMMENNFTIIAAIKRALADKRLRCVCSVDERAYRKWIEKKQPWRYLLRPVWLHPLPKMPW